MSSGKRLSEPSDELPVPNSSIEKPRQLLQAFQRGHRVVCVLHGDTLGDFQAQGGGLGPRLGQHALDEVDEAGVAVLARGEIDGDPQGPAVAHAARRAPAGRTDAAPIRRCA